MKCRLLIFVRIMFSVYSIWGKVITLSVLEVFFIAIGSEISLRSQSKSSRYRKMRKEKFTDVSNLSFVYKKIRKRGNSKSSEPSGDFDYSDYAKIGMLCCHCVQGAIFARLKTRL